MDLSVPSILTAIKENNVEFEDVTATINDTVAAANEAVYEFDGEKRSGNAFKRHAKIQPNQSNGLSNGCQTWQQFFGFTFK